MSGQKSSPLWQIFTEPMPGKAKCNICNDLVSMGAETGKKKNTTNMWNHLKTHHFPDYKEAQIKRNAARADPLQPAAITQILDFDAQRKWQKSDPRSKKIDILVTEMIATDNQPFSVVSNVGFQRLMTVVEPRYNLENEEYYRTYMLDILYSKVVTKIRSLTAAANAGPCVSFTTDCWSEETGSLISLTCHFIDNEWERKQVVLNVKAMTGSNTGDYISELFLDMMDQWKINQKRVVLVLRDSGANMIEGIRLAEIPDLNCSAHTLQSVVNEGLSSQEAVEDIISKLKTCAMHFNQSTLAKQRLKAIQEELFLPRNEIIQAVPSCWNSTLHMLQRMLEQRCALNVYAGERWNFTCPTAEEWDIVSNLIEILGPIEEVTLEMSKTEASVSCIIPSIAILKMLLQTECRSTRGIGTLRETMLQILEDKFSMIEETKCLVLATLLDPRYKGHIFAGEDTLNNAKQWLKEERESTSKSDQQKKTTRGYGLEPKRIKIEGEEPSNLVDRMYANILWAHSQHGPPIKEVKEDITEELECYLQEPVIDRRTGMPLKWWKQNQTRLRLLAPLARKYLCPPPSCVPSERVFGDIGTIYEKWNRHSGENVEKLCFLHHNLQLLNWDY